MCDTRFNMEVLKEVDAEVKSDAKRRYVEGARDESDQEPKHRALHSYPCHQCQPEKVLLLS